MDCIRHSYRNKLLQQYGTSGGRFKVSATPIVFQLLVRNQTDDGVTHVPTDQFTA
jgi:hypothetical protein